MVMTTRTRATAVEAKRALAYMRVSTAEQATEKHLSLDEQETRIGAYCAAHGWPVVGRFNDVGSGRKDTRPEYQRMVALAMSGGADTVVVQYLDRFGRNPREILRRVWQLQEANVEVVCTDEDVSQELMLLVKAGIAGQESKRNGERVKGYMKRHARDGMKVGRPPYGYRAVRSITGPDAKDVTVSYEQNPDEAAAVREMYRLVVDGNLGGKAVADHLNRIGAPARAGTWSSDSIRRILDNPALMGRLVYAPLDAPEVIDGFYKPAILTPHEWAALCERRALRAAGPPRAVGSDYLLTGILRCGHCGGAMQGRLSSRTPSGKQYRSYRCAQATRARDLCATLNGHSTRLLEAAVLVALAAYSDPDIVRAKLAEEDLRASSVDHAADRRRLEQELNALDADFRANLDLLKRGILDEQEFARANAGRRSDRATLEARLAELVAQDRRASGREAHAAALPGRVVSFLDAVATMDVRAAKGMLQTILSAAYVWNDRRVELEFRTA